MSLLDAIEALAVKLAREVVAAIGASTLSDVLIVGARATAVARPTPRSPRQPPVTARRTVRGRGGRVAPDDVAAKAIEVLRRSPEGLRSETLRTLVGAPKPTYQQVMTRLVAAGQVAKAGSNRATTYCVA